MPLSLDGPIRGILLKIGSVLLFLGMQTFIKLAGDEIPAGQVTFFRSAFAFVPIMLYLALRSQLVEAWKTRNPLGHLKRGTLGLIAMALGFFGLMKLPLPEAISLGYATPLVAVAFAAIFLKETVRIYRWSAVVVGIIGVMIVSWPQLTLFRTGGMQSEQAIGALSMLMASVIAGMAMIQVRRLVEEEKTTTIVLYFSVTASILSLLTLPFGWMTLDWQQKLLLVAAGFLGGIAQIFLTECYRHADVSTVAPFEYTSILFGGIVGYSLFGEVPTLNTLIGTVIVAGSGLFIIYRERQLGLERARVRQAA